MKFKCLTEECEHKFQEIEVRIEQLTAFTPQNLQSYIEKQVPFFYTIPPVYCGYCGYCGKPATRVYSE